MANFLRQPTEEEKRDFISLYDKEKAKVDFLKEMEKHMKIARDKMLPFARRACLDEFNDKIDGQVKLSIRKNGYLNWNDVKKPEMNFEKFYDLKNFELIEEGERLDEHLTKVNPGLNVMLKYKRYKFNGYSGMYSVMEDVPEAIQRALAEKRKLEKQLDNTINTKDTMPK